MPPVAYLLPHAARQRVMSAESHCAPMMWGIMSRCACSRGMGANVTTPGSLVTAYLMQRVIDVQVNASEEPHARRRRLLPPQGQCEDDWVVGEDEGMSLAQPLSDERGEWDEGGSLGFRRAVARRHVILQ